MRIHICDICNKRGTWNENWSWKFVAQDFRDEQPFKVCSDNCLNKAATLKKKDKFFIAIKNRFNEREINRPQGIVKS